MAPLAMWLLLSFFAEVPTEIAEAATIDGCGDGATLAHVYLPLVMVLADHSKMGRAHLTNIAPLGAADILITDESADEAVPVATAAAGVRVLYAPLQIDGRSEVSL